MGSLPRLGVWSHGLCGNKKSAICQSSLPDGLIFRVTLRKRNLVHRYAIGVIRLHGCTVPAYAVRQLPIMHDLVTVCAAIPGRTSHVF